MSPALLLLNGPPGIGKSTVARRLTDTRPLSLALDIDWLRRSLGGWMERPKESGVLARELAVAVATKHLQSGHPVVVPQFLGRLGFVEQLEQLAGEADVPFLHVVLITDKSEATARFFSRCRADDATEQHREAEVLAGGEAGFGHMYDGLLTVVAARPDALLVASGEGDPAGTCRAVQEALAGRW